MSIKKDLRKLRMALTPRSWKLTTTLSNGAVVRGLNRAGYGGRGVYLHRDALKPELLHLDELLEPDGVFIDIGANTGVYALKAAKHYGRAGTVVAVEPFVEVLSTLAESIAANSLSNVRLRNLCVGEQTGVRTLWMNQDKPNSFSITNRFGEARGVSVLTVSLDDLMEWEQLERLDYLKIDAEGAEPEILHGAAETIRRHRPHRADGNNHHDGCLPRRLPGVQSATQSERHPDSRRAPQDRRPDTVGMENAHSMNAKAARMRNMLLLSVVRPLWLGWLQGPCPDVMSLPCESL